MTVEVACAGRRLELNVGSPDPRQAPKRNAAEEYRHCKQHCEGDLGIDEDEAFDAGHAQGDLVEVERGPDYHPPLQEAVPLGGVSTRLARGDYATAQESRAARPPIHFLFKVSGTVLGPCVHWPTRVLPDRSA